MENSINNRRLRIAAVVAIAILALFIYILAYLPDSGPSVQEMGVSDTVASAAAFGTDSFVFSNGQTLEVHDYATGDTRAIGPSNAGLGPIDSVSVSPNGEYVLFHDRTFNTNGILGTLLTQQNLDTGLDYWWLYSVKNQTFQYLPQDIILAKLDNNFVYTLSSSGTTEQITTYRNSNLQQTSTIDVVGSSNFYPLAGRGFLLQTPDNELLFTKDGIVSNELIHSIVLSGVTSDGQMAVGTQTEKSSHNLISIDLRNNTTRTIATNLVSAPAWLNSGTVLYATNSNHLNFYDLHSGKNSNWFLGGSLAKTAPSNLKLISVVGQSAAIVMDQSGTNHLIGPKIATGSIK